MKRLKQQFAFLNELEKLKTVSRKNLTLDNARPENSAEHSWHVTAMASILLEESHGIDRLKVLKMLLFHDVAEIYAGDTFLFDREEKEHIHAKEKKALAKLVNLLPWDQRTEIGRLWLEFEDGKTKEAKYARSLDALQPLMSHLLTAPEGYNPYGLTARQVWEKKEFIKESAPEFWPVAEETIRKSVERGLYD